MTFEELNGLVVAIRARGINFDYFERVFSMSIFPEYGYKKSVEGKSFQIEIQNCVYFCCSNTSKMAGGNETEFIMWGKHLEEECNKKYCNELVEHFLSKTPSAAVGKDSMMRKDSDEQHYHYFFQNALGDAIDILATKDFVKEIKVTEELKDSR